MGLNQLKMNLYPVFFSAEISYIMDVKIYCNRIYSFLMDLISDKSEKDAKRCIILMKVNCNASEPFKKE